jgi:hypothetical protein
MSQKVTLFLLIAVLLVPASMTAGAQQLPPPGQTLSPDQLDDLVAPIALYPDPLISQILVASTYPLEIVEANQWLQKNPSLTGAALTEAVTNQNWDPSVQALVAFPDVLKFLTEDVGWTSNLGNAFLAQESDVMDAIQRMRARAAQNGKLNSSPQEVVTQTYDGGRPIYEILPAQPDVIYVPYYDPTWIWGDPLFYPYPHWYYPPHAHVLYYSPPISLQFYYGSGWQGWNYWGWRPGWTTRSIVINNTFVHRYNFNSSHLSNFSGTTTWTHDVTHRQGVPYPSQALTERYRAGVRQNLSVPQQSVGGARPAPAQASRPAPAASTAPSNVTSAPRQSVPNDRVGAREISPNSPNRDRSAFGSVENGEASRLHSDHGYSSLGPNRSMPPQAAQHSAGQQPPVVHQAPVHQAPQAPRPVAPAPRPQASAPVQHAAPQAAHQSAPQAPHQAAPAQSHSNNRGNGR